MTARERRQRIARVRRWFVGARAQERLQGRWPEWEKYLKKYPKAGVINTTLLDDLFQLIIDRS